MEILDSIGILNVMDNKQGIIINKLNWEVDNEEYEDENYEDDMQFLIQIADKEAYKMFMKDMYFNKKDMIKFKDFLNKYL